MRIRESITNLIEGRLSSTDGRAALVKLATRLIFEQGLETEIRDMLDRDYCEHGVSPRQGLRNGVRMGFLKTAKGLMDYAALQIASREEPFRSEIRRGVRHDHREPAARGAAAGHRKLHRPGPERAIETRSWSSNPSDGAPLDVDSWTSHLPHRCLIRPAVRSAHLRHVRYAEIPRRPV